MPYKFQYTKTKLKPHQDRRRKLTPEQVKDIQTKRHKLQHYYKLYSPPASQSLIKKYYYNIQPNNPKDKWKRYYDKATHAERTRRYRQRRQQLIKNSKN